MRYVLAIAALVIAGVLLLLGIGQRTFLAGPSEISFPVDIVADTRYAMVNGAEFGKLPGQANVVVRGGEAFVATASARDVQGWVAEFPHAELTVDLNKQRLLSALVAGKVDDGTPSDHDQTSVDDASAADSDSGAGSASGNAPTGLDPRGSDLWLEERSLEGNGSDVEAETLRVPVSLSEDQAVLIASNGEDSVPKDVSLVWVQDPDTPWAGPLLVGGGVFALLGGILYLLAIDHNRRGLGPRRGRRGPFQGIRNALPRGEKRAAGGPSGSNGSSGGAARSVSPLAAVRRRRLAAAVPALGIAVALGLSGCSANYWPKLSPESPAKETSAPATPASSALAPVPVSDAQLKRIVKRVSDVAAEGDSKLDAKVLRERFTGDALAQREASYKIRSAIADYAVVPPTITDQGLEYELVQSTDAWPRTLFVTVASSSEPVDPSADEGAVDAEQTKSSPSLAMILTQETPHTNYQVSRILSLRGGISMPAAAPAEEGTALLANDSSTLVLPPDEVAKAYASLLQNGKDAPASSSFDLSSDTLLESYGKVRAADAQRANEAEGQTVKFSSTAREGDKPPVALSTGTGGALVATTVTEELVADAAGGRFKPQARDVVTALSGLQGEQEKIVQQVSHQLLFYVPSKTDGAKIELLGVTSELVGARNS